MIIHIKNKDTLIVEGFEFKCAIGKRGIRKNKSEGDFYTPSGKFEIGKLYWRPDRVEKPDTKKFPSLTLAKDCINSGGTSFSTLNAANEECVASFLEGRIGYLDIHKIISEVLDKSDIKMVEEIEDIFEADMQSREMTKELININ